MGHVEITWDIDDIWLGAIVNRTLISLCACVVVFATVQIGVASSAGAAPTRFTSCDAMHQYYKYGISMNKKAQQRAVQEGMYKPSLQPRVYADSYKTLDRDKDGTMCEVPR